MTKLYENQFELGKQNMTVSFNDTVLLKIIINNDVLVFYELYLICLQQNKQSRLKVIPGKEIAFP